MPRRNTFKSEGDQPTSMVAAATNYTSARDASKPIGSATSWQTQAWDFFDSIGEFRYVMGWRAKMMSRARFTVMEKGKPTNNPAAIEALNAFFDGPIGQQQALSQLALHDGVAGESYTFAWEEGGETRWEVAAPQRVTKLSSGDWKVDGVEIGSKPFVIRTWNPDPLYPARATSPSKAAMPILNEIFRLTQHIESQVTSRLLSAGLLLLPNEMAFSAATQKNDDKVSNDSKSEQFIKQFIEVAQTAIRNRGDASAQIPMVLTSEAEHLDKPRLLEFWSELDEHALAMRTEAIRRLGLALDVPPEVLTGTGDISHWQAWGVNDASIKANLEPDLDRYAADFTAGYLRPALTGDSRVADPKDFEFRVDTTSMRVRPNRSQESIELYNLGQLKAESMRRENGFDEDDRPGTLEQNEWLYRQVAKMAADAEMSAQALQHLGLDITAPVDSGEANAPQADPSLDDHPDETANPSDGDRRDLEKDAERKQRAASLLAAAEQMVFRALERGGNKIKSKLKFSVESATADALYLYRENTDAEASYMLDGAFDYVDRFADKFGLHPDALKRSLESYTRSLIVNREPHTTERLAAHLNKESTHV